MNPKYAPRTPEGRRHRLGEEIGEVMIEAGQVLQMLGKAARFDLNSRHPNGGPTNREELLRLFAGLRREIDDVSEAVTLVESDLLDGIPCQALG